MRTRKKPQFSKGPIRAHEAFLYDPYEAKHEVDIGAPDNPAYIDGDWVLLAKTSDAFFDAVDDNRQEFRSYPKIIETQLGAGYLILVNQISTFQNLILLPLYEPKVAMMFSGPEKAFLSVSILKEGANHARGFRASFADDQIGTIRDMVEAMKARRTVDYINEVDSVISDFRHPKTVSSILENVSVKKSCVTYAMPAWVLGFGNGLHEFLFSEESVN